MNKNEFKNLFTIKIVLFAILFYGFGEMKAQVTIGSDYKPNPNAVLDLRQNEDKTSNGGLLMPRVNLQSLNSPSPLSEHIAGMFVYNLNSGNDIKPGLYFNDGSKWVRAIGPNDIEVPEASGTWFIQGTNGLSNSNTDNIWHQNKVAIGANSIPSTEASATLFVNGDMAITGKYYTTSSVYADYVFEKYLNNSSALNPEYKFRSLSEIKEFINNNKHLPGVTPIDALQKSDNGYVVDMTALAIEQLEKIEELYLHVIELSERLDKKDQELTELREKLDNKN